MTQVRLEIGRGDVVLEVFEKRAPRAAGYFLGLIDSGAYDGSTIYRSTTLAAPDGSRLVQGGPLGWLLAPSSERPRPDGPRIESLPQFETTRETGLVHDTGVLSLARDLLDTGDAIAEFFVCLGRFPELDAGGRSEPDDRGFPAFGRVVEGLDVIEAVAQLPTDGSTPIEMLRGQILSSTVRIGRAVRR